jgi:PTH1 family peptidyl-tRNA hydrolase
MVREGAIRVGGARVPKLIVGLGNPGARYEKTRHNVGWMALDALAKKHGVEINKSGFQGLYGEWRRAAEKIILLKPSTYMNLSGKAVGPAASFYKIPPSEILVVYDDLDLPPGKLRIREKGSAGGHNGMKSLIETLGTQEFPRVRIGIGRPAPGWQVVDWVLAPFGADDLPLITAAVDEAVKAMETWLDEGTLAAMNKHNRG